VSFDSRFLQRIPVDMSLLRNVAHLEHARGRQRLFQTQVPELLKQLKTIATIESTESSTRLEGVVAPRERIEGVVLRDAAPQGRSEAEIAGYRDALRMIHESAEHIPFRESSIQQIHQLLYRYLSVPGGRYKATSNDIVEKNSSGSIVRVRFSPLSPVQTPGAMRGLIEGYETAVDEGEVPPLLLVALAVLDFLCIHPFPDGNGRAARLITLLLLYQHGYEVGRYVSLERVIEESREGYYETLEASSVGWHEGEHDARPWIDYFLAVLTAAYGELEERITAVREGGGGTKTEMIRTAVSRRRASFQISDLERELPNVSRELIRAVLKDLREEGALRLEGVGRGAKYVPTFPSA
jgi:Fic family protein